MISVYGWPMRREWSDEELVGSWTLVDEDWRLVGDKSGVTRLGFALLLKFFEIEARFPRVADEVPAAAVAYVVLDWNFWSRKLLQLADPGLELLAELTACAILGLKVDVARYAG